MYSIKIAAPENFVIFTVMHLCWSLFMKKRHCHSYLPVNVAKFLRTPILKIIIEWLLLHFEEKCSMKYLFQFVWFASQDANYPNMQKYNFPNSIIQDMQEMCLENV